MDDCRHKLGGASFKLDMALAASAGFSKLTKPQPCIHTGKDNPDVNILFILVENFKQVDRNARSLLAVALTGAVDIYR